MNVFVNDYVIPGAIIVAQSVVMLVALLVFIAYILYADRKIWAAVQIAPRAERRGPMGAAAVLRRPAEVHAEGAGDPGFGVQDACSCWLRWSR